MPRARDLHDRTGESPLALRRAKLGLLQKDVAAMCGVSVSAVSLWESRLREPDRAEVRAKYAAALRMTVGQLGSLIYEASLGVTRGEGNGA